MLRRIARLVKSGVFGHLFLMLDVLRKREPAPERIFSPREFRAIADDFDLPRTPLNMLSLMLAIGTGRFVRIEFDYELR